ncbi:helix-turn-helix domain-containing protein [Nocardia fluminea]|uniref:helix-turn-helix domain-containing protein n=1 Tax=Nocardia fluminea TaxID=134984 RepID=UPI0033D4F265
MFAHLGYSTRTLNRLARENAGLSAELLIGERVLLEAKRLLAHSPDPAARIAEYLGFDDPANFAKYFLHRTGTTPADFRAHVRNTSTGPDSGTQLSEVPTAPSSACPRPDRQVRGVRGRIPAAR